MFFSRKASKKNYDTRNKTAVLRCSICTGERVAGFRDNSTGLFEEVMLIESDSDLEAFKKAYGVSLISTEY